MKIPYKIFMCLLPDWILAGIEPDGAAIKPKLVPAAKERTDYIIR
jgi:hypothetical protein